LETEGKDQIFAKPHRAFGVLYSISSVETSLFCSRLAVST